MEEITTHLLLGGWPPSAALKGGTAMLFSQILSSALSLLFLQSSLVTPLAVPRALTNTIPQDASQFLNSITETVGDLIGDFTLPESYTLPQNSKHKLLRAAGVTTKRTTFLYGPPVAGGPYFPAGLLGLERVALDQAYIQLDLAPELAAAVLDDTKATADIAKYDGLDSLKDYTKLYDGEWQNTLPDGPLPGVETNYTQDLLFSMERLSISPYQVRRLDPSSDSLEFEIDDSTAKAVSGMTLAQLLQAGRLFYADYRDQANLTPTTRYSAACDAYFYIDESSGEFLPLAIRTNVGSNLIYTPKDSPNDWLLAKMMYNVNDFWFAQWNHLAGTHEVVQIAYMAAIRTLSEEHPVLAVLNRLMYEVFAIQPLAAAILFLPGTAVDLVFPYTGSSAQSYTTDRYNNKGAGRFQANYFTTDLENRGLINSNVGPELKNFPFYEDASTIWNAIHKFMTTFVESYYSSDSVVKADQEVQAWVKEANGPARCFDFPSAISSRATLVDVLTHFAHLASTAHHTVNTNELLSVSSTLPFHPPSLYHPIPKTKNTETTKPADFLPPFTKILEQFSVAALFARPFLVNTNRTLLHMFDDEAFLKRTNTVTQQAAAKFKSSMEAFSAVVSARGFDADGLSQGMPFVWPALDPNVQPYSITT